MPDDPDNDLCPSCGDYLSDENELRDSPDSSVIGDYGYSCDPDDNEYDYPGCPDDNDEHNDQYYDEQILVLFMWGQIPESLYMIKTYIIL